MKKITSILCALALVLSVSAAPQLKSIKNAASADKTMLEKAAVLNPETAKTIHFAQAKAIKAPAIRKATYDIEIVYVSEKYYASSSDIYCVMYDKSGMIYRFDIFIEAGTEELALDHEYTEADLDNSYSWWGTSAATGLGYDELSFIKTVDGEGNVKIVVVATDENGDVLNLTYDPANLPVAPAGGAFAADEIGINAGSGYVQYVLTSSADDLKFFFCINLASGTDVESGVTYTEADLDLDYSGAEFYGYQGVDVVTATFTKTVALDGSYTIDAAFVDADGNNWKVTAEQTAPTVIDLTFNKGVQFYDNTASSGTQHWQVMFEDDEYQISLVALTDVIAGDYEASDLYADYTAIVDKVNGIIFTMTSGTVTVTENVDGSINFAGTFVDDNHNTIFNLDITYVEPTAEVTVDVNITDALFSATTFTYYWYSYAGYMISGTDANGVTVALELVADDINGDFTSADLWEDPTVVDEGADVAIYTVGDIHIESDDVARTRTLTVELLGFNSKLYKVTMTGEIPEPQDFEFSFSGTEVYFEDNIADYGYWEFVGENDDVEIWFSNAGSIDHIAGTYATDDLDGDYSYVYDKATGTQVGFSAAVVEITEQSNGSLHLYAECVGKDGNNYIITMQYGDAPTAIENTKAEVKAVKVLRNGQLVIIKNGVEYNAVGAQVK